MKLPTAFLVIGATGVMSLTTSTGMYAFCIASSLFFTCIGIGGVKKYLSQESEDVRDIYKEKDLMQKEKISLLTEKLIEKEKQIILLSANKLKQTNTNISNITTNEQAC